MGKKGKRVVKRELSERSGAFDRLLTWFFCSRRDLPWRRERSLYSVLVSEMMLQQTQVSRVIEYYTRFMERFPTIEALASASLDEVYFMWSGLGYYRRARYLWETAKCLVRDGLPSSGWENLPGLGRYTASAIRAFAFNECVGVVDANVGRVLARFRGILSTKQERLQKVMTTLVAYGKRLGYESRDVNEAFMELGALLCGRERKCYLCPLARACCTYLRGEDLFVISQKKSHVDVKEKCYAYLTESGEVWMVQNGRWREGLWDLPTEEESVFGKEKSGGFVVTYGVTRHRVQREVEVYRVMGEGVSGSGRWVSVFQPDVALGSPAKRCLVFLQDFLARN